MKKSELKYFVKSAEETIVHWEEEENKEPNDSDMIKWLKGYTSGYNAAVRELKEEFNL